MNPFCVWIRPSGGYSRGEVDVGPGIKRRLGEPVGRRGTTASSSEVKSPSVFWKTACVTIPALSAMRKEDKLMTWIANACGYFVLDLPPEIWRATKEFVGNWWYSHLR